MVFNPCFNNISGISLPSDLLVEETGVPAIHGQMLPHNDVSSALRLSGIRTR
jgi:hypothetical protein